MRLFLTLGLLALLVAGCSGKSKDPQIASAGGPNRPTASATPSLSSEEMQRLFTKCMRDHGVDIPDPGSGPQGGSVAISQGPEMGAANKACEKYMPAGSLQTPSAADQAKALQFARCMRQHGVNIPDPGPGGGALVASNGAGGPTGINPNDKAFQDANKACKHFLPEGGQLQTQGAGGGR